MASLAMLGVLAGARLGLALAEASCEWVGDADKCTAVAQLGDDSTANALLADAGTCIANTAEGMQGCMEDLPECQAVTVSGLGSWGICVPTFAVLGTINVNAAESLFQIENCAGISTPDCDEVRANYYGLLGCPECVEEANAAAALEATCAAVTAAADCGGSTSATDTSSPRDFDIALEPYGDTDGDLYVSSSYADDAVEFDGPAYGESIEPGAFEPVQAFALPGLEPLAPEPVTYDYYFDYNYLGDGPAPAPGTSTFSPLELGGGVDEGADGYLEGYYEGSYAPATYAVQLEAVADPFSPVPFSADPPVTDLYDAGPYTNAYYDGYGDYPAPYGDVPTGAAIAPLELGSIDVGAFFPEPSLYDDEAVADAADADGPEGLTAGDVRQFLGPVLNDDSDADAPATILLEPFAAASPGPFASWAMQSLALLAAALCMLV